MKGFKDSSNKFHPITDYKKGTRKSRDQSAKTQGVRMKKQQKFETRTYKVWTFRNAPKEIKEKILEKNRSVNVEFDDFWSDFDGIIYDKKTNIGDYDVFDKYSKKYYDLDRGQYIQFPDLEIKDEKKLYKMLGLPSSLVDKISIRFDSTRKQHSNTEIDFIENESGSNLAIDDPELTYEVYKKDTLRYGEKPLTQKEYVALQKANEKWNDLMNSAWKTLSDAYYYEQSDEAIDDFFTNNEHYKFKEDGSMDR